MAIPVKFQQFKSAGIYRVVYDKSTVLGTEAELLRLVVGYSPKGPFNTPVYIKSVSDFKTIFGDISKSLENRGCFFHRTCIQALEAGPILCLNLKKFDENTTVSTLRISDVFELENEPVRNIFDTTRFWKLEPDNLNTGSNYLTISSVDSIETSGSVFVRKAAESLVKAYDISVSDWYKSYNESIPEYLVGYEDKKISEFFAEVFVFGGKFTKDQITASTTLQKYFTDSYYTEYVEGADITKTVISAPTAKMVGDDVVEGDSAYYVVSTLRDIDGVQYGIPERISVIPTTFTLDGDAYAVPASKITYVDTDSGIIGKGPGYYLTSSLKYEDNRYVIIADSIGAQFALGIGSDNLMYAANQVVKVGAEFYAKDSVIYTDALDIAGSLLKPSIKATAGDPIFGVTGNEGELIVVPTITNAFGDEVDALTGLYGESTSGAVGHYVGCLLPNFYDNNSGYKSLDILFNLDSDIHHMMMSLDDTMLSVDGAIGNVVLTNGALKNGISNRKPYFLQGYSYPFAKPNGTTLKAKIDWQNDILAVVEA